MRDKRHFAEDIGLLLDHEGLPRMAGRIWGWLLICDPPHQSFNQLAEVLQASRGSISTMTQLLIRLGLVQRISLPGERRDYFRIRTGVWSEIMRHRMGATRKMRLLAEEGMTLLSQDPPGMRARLEEMHHFYAFFEREFPVLIDRWEKEYHDSRGP